MRCPRSTIAFRKTSTCISWSTRRMAMKSAWNQHAETVRTLVDDRLETKGRSIVLRNHTETMLTTPFATVSNLRETFGEIAAAADPDQDILMLYIGGKGARNGAIPGSLPPLDLVALTPVGLKSLLDDAGFQWRIIIVAACYAGAYADVLQDERTAVVAASASDRPSFGCEGRGDPTFFGDALFSDGFARTDSLAAAFAVAVIASRRVSTSGGYPLRNRRCALDVRSNPCCVTCGASAAVRPRALGRAHGMRWPGAIPLRMTGHRGCRRTLHGTPRWHLTPGSSPKTIARNRGRASPRIPGGLHAPSGCAHSARFFRGLPHRDGGCRAGSRKAEAADWCGRQDAFLLPAADHRRAQRLFQGRRPGCRDPRLPRRGEGAPGAAGRQPRRSLGRVRAHGDAASQGPAHRSLGAAGQVRRDRAGHCRRQGPRPTRGRPTSKA